MNKKAMYALSYGLFVVTARVGQKDNGCITNTVAQVTTQPNRITLAVNRTNYTCDMIRESGCFTVSVIAENAEFGLFKRFGFQSGRDTDKFAGYDAVREIDLGSHILFVAEVTDMDTLTETPSATYTYYQNSIKPKPEKKEKTAEGKTVWRCKICGYEYVGEELPEDFICPLCKHPASDFEKVTA